MKKANVLLVLAAVSVIGFGFVGASKKGGIETTISDKSWNKCGRQSS
jgi:hypothetical protein